MLASIDYEVWVMENCHDMVGDDDYDVVNNANDDGDD